MNEEIMECMRVMFHQIKDINNRYKNYKKEPNIII